MYNSGIEIPRVDFSLINFNKIAPGSYFIGFDLDNGGKLSKIDSNGTITIIEYPDLSYEYEIGQYVSSEGGVIFHRYKDGSTENYLVVDTTNLSTSSAWSNINGTVIGSTAQSTWDGLSNSNAIVGQSGHTSSAAKLCLDSTNNSKSDWYLPSFDELNLLFNNRFNVNKTLSGNSSFGSISGATEILNNIYWTSTEVNSTTSVVLDIRFGSYANNTKSVSNYVRAVRKFSIPL